MLTLATTISSMRPPPCDDYRRQHHQCIEANGQQLALLYAALYTIALGGDGIKSIVSGFGSDQFDATDPKEDKAMVFFFNRVYFYISIGSLFNRHSAGICTRQCRQRVGIWDFSRDHGYCSSCPALWNTMVPFQEASR